MAERHQSAADFNGSGPLGARSLAIAGRFSLRTQGATQARVTLEEVLFFG